MEEAPIPPDQRMFQHIGSAGFTGLSLAGDLLQKLQELAKLYLALLGSKNVPGGFSVQK